MLYTNQKLTKTFFIYKKIYIIYTFILTIITSYTIVNYKVKLQYWSLKFTLCVQLVLKFEACAIDLSSFQNEQYKSFY